VLLGVTAPLFAQSFSTEVLTNLRVVTEDVQEQLNERWVFRLRRRKTTMQEYVFAGRVDSLVIFRVPEFGTGLGSPSRIRDGVWSSALSKAMLLEN
jgi:hypothetical protein